MASLLVLGASVARSQKADEAKIREELVGHPLYLRGFWMGPTLEFDGDGKLIGEASRGQVTLSGVDVKSVAVRGDQMQIRAVRVALIADASGRLQRQVMTSTTLMVFTYRRKFEAKDEVKITLHADAAGDFEQPLKAVFADGLQELGPSVPAYWSCYAKVYFAEAEPQADADRVVEACAKRLGARVDGDTEGVTGPQLVSRMQRMGTSVAAELGVAGESRIHFTVGPHGIPLRFQVVRAVGAGVDETVMRAIAESTFTPATRNGEAVAADMELTMKFESAQR